MKRTRSVFVFLLVFLVGCQQATWEEFRSSEGKFSVLMPGRPTKQIRSVKTPSGALDAHMFLVEQGNVAYMVAYSDYPAIVIQDRPAKLILDGARSGAVRNAQGKLVGESQISLDGHQGRELDIETTEGKTVIKARIVLVGHRLYQVMVLTRKEQASSEEVKKFLDSFTLHPQAPEPKAQGPTLKT